jgi:hypothetical protein
MRIKRPNFHDLTPLQQAQFGNGVGPYWLPAWARHLITTTVSWFFKDASWRHHDFGYVVGGDRWDRARCDWKFLVAMLRDAWTQEGWSWPLAVPIAVLISLFFYLNVRLFGQFGSFEYRDTYATLDEVIEAYHQ